MSVPPEIGIYRRKLPHWRLEGSTYYISFKLAQDVFSQRERQIVLKHIRSGHGRFYTLLACVVMPDHVHTILKPHKGVELSRIMKGIKGVSARQINQARGARGTLWQGESWDRIIRDEAELGEKFNYMLMNPFKRGLVEDPWRYDGWFFNDNF